MKKAPVHKTARVTTCAAVAPSGWWMALAIPAGAAIWVGLILLVL